MPGWRPRCYGCLPLFSSSPSMMAARVLTQSNLAWMAAASPARKSMLCHASRARKSCLLTVRELGWGSRRLTWFPLDEDEALMPVVLVHGQVHTTRDVDAELTLVWPHVAEQCPAFIKPDFHGPSMPRSSDVPGADSHRSRRGDTCCPAGPSCMPVPPVSLRRRSRHTCTGTCPARRSCRHASSVQRQLP